MTAEQRPPRLINTATQERGRSSGLADGFDLARLDGTYAVLRLSAETEQRSRGQVQERLLVDVGGKSSPAIVGKYISTGPSVTSFVHSEPRWPQLTDAAASG